MNKSDLSSIKNILFSSKPSKAIRLLLMVLFVSMTPLVSFGQCSYPVGATSVGTYTFCIDNSNTITTANVNAGQYALVNVINGYNYTFTIGNVWNANGNPNRENLTLFDASNDIDFGVSGYNRGQSGTSITWTATISGQIKVLLSKNCGTATTGGTLTLTLNSLGNTQDSQTAFGTNNWIGHIYNSVAGASPEPFTNANYAGYYNVSSETISEGFSGDYVCFPVLSNGTQRASVYTELFAVRYRMQSTRAAGYYFMNANADDGIRVTVDGVTVLNDWTDHSNTQYCNNLIYLNGSSNIIMDYYENVGGNVVGFNLAPITGNTISNYTDINVCSGNSPGNLNGSNLLSCTGTTNTTYQWQSSTDNVNFTNIVGATSEDYTPLTVTTTSVDIKYYRRVLKASGVAITASNPSTGSVKVTTNPSAPVAPGTITGATTQCAGNTLQTYSVVAVTNATSYNWILPANWTVTAGAGTNSIAVSIANNGASNNVSVNAANGCGTSGFTSKYVTVSSPTVAGTVTPANTNVCSGSNSTNLSLSGNTGSILRWESSTDNFAGGSITTIASTGSPITASNITVDTYYRAVVQNGGCNILNTSSVKLTVVGSMTNPGGISINGVSYPVNGSTTNCALTTMTFSIAAVANATSYTWTVGGGWTIVSGQGTTSVSVTTGNTSQSNNISVYATNGACPQTAASYLYVTLSSPVSPTGAAAQTFCSGATVANLSATGTNIKWYTASTGGIALATTTALTNGTHYYATQNPSGCESTTRLDVTTTINTSPTISGSVTPATCSNGSDGAITITGLSVPIEFKKADNDYINLGSSFLSGRGAFTLEGWVKFNIADVGSRMSLFGQNDVIEFFLNPTTIQLYTAGGGGITTPLTAALGNNTWHHIAATGDGTNLRIFIDGALVATGGSTTSNYGTSTETSKIGSGVVDGITYTTGGGGGFTGQMQKVGFYSTALLPATITSLATSPTTYLGTETGLIAGYNFFEGSGTTLTKLPVGTNGTFGNSPQWVYTYAWTKTGTPAYTASTKNISGLSPGDYNLIISGGQCPITKTFTVGATNTTPSTPIVGTTTQPNCTVPKGSVVLSGLPAGNWTINPGGIIGNTSSATISDLAAGTYNFTVSIGACTSSATGNVVINPAITNTWTTSWSNGTPNSTQKLVFSGNYPPVVDPNENITGCSCMVTGAATVTIKSGRTLTITNEVTVVGGGKLTFEDTASLVQINNTAINSGDITYKRTTSSVLNSDYTYWSSPVANQKLNISPSYGSGTFYSYNDFAIPEDWQKETASTTMQIGKGYIIRGPQVTGPPPPPGLYDAIFVGVPNNGAKTIAIGPVGTSNLLGNPYPSAIDGDAFLSANSTIVEGTIYFWTHNTAIQLASNITGVDEFGNPKVGSGALAYTSDDYASYNGTGGAATSGGITPTGKIAAGQAFFTTSIATGAAVTFSNTMRLAGTTLADKTGTNQQFFKIKNTNTKTTSTIEKNRIWLNLTNTKGAFKQTLIGYITDATNDYDSRFDGESFDGNEFVDFYSINQDKNLVIQGRALPFDENDEVPLGFRSTIEGSFTINIDQVDGSLANQSVFIEDKLTNTVFDLKGGNYTFNTVAGTFDDRFVLKYNNKTLSVDEIDTKDRILVLYSNNSKTLIIQNIGMDSTVNRVTLYNMTGQNIANWDINNGEQTNIQIPIKNVSAGIYIAKVKTSKGQSSKKIIIK